MKSLNAPAFVFLSFALVLVLPLAATPQTAAPMLINYQGELHSPTTGDPVPDGSYDMVFRIYGVLSAGTALWTGTHSAANGNAVQVTNGIFSVILGSGTGNALEASLFDGADRWLETKVGTETLSPRQPMTSVAYSIASENSRLFGGKQASEFAGSIHGHSGSDITSGTVAEAWIDPLITRDSERDAAITAHAAISNAHHARYTDAEAVAAMGAKSPNNPLNHDKTTKFAELTDVAADAQIPATIARDAEVTSAISTHSAIADAHHSKTTKFSELTDIAADVQIPASIARDSEIMPAVLANDGTGSGLDADKLDGAESAALEESAEIDADIAAHKAIPDAHHAKTTKFSELTDVATDAQIPAPIARDSEIMPTVLANDGTGSGLDADKLDGMEGAALEESGEIDSDVAAHKAIADAHHARYTNAEAVAAMGAKANTNPLNHDKTTTFSELTGSASDAQIPATIARDSEVTSGIATHAGIADAHHARYTNAEAVAAMGAKTNTNPLNHDKTTTFSELTGAAADAQIPASIARDSEIMPTVLANDGTGSGLDADKLDGAEAAALEESAEIDADIAAHTAVANAHHSRYSDAEARAAMGAKADSNPLNHDKTTSLPWGSITSIPAGFADGVDDNSGGDITGVTAGVGLTGGGAAGGVTLSAEFGGSGSANTVAHSDHGHGGAYWLLTGNTGTSGTNFLGTTDSQALELRVNNGRALRLEPNADSPNVIGGHSENSASTGVVGAAIGGGGMDLLPNRVTDTYGTIGGGVGNTASGPYATVGGGMGNIASDESATVGGGGANHASGPYATVAGGNGNTAGTYCATVAGGIANIASGEDATVGGGCYNKADASYATIAGGGPSDPANPLTTRNVVTDDYGTIGGGGGNQAGDNAGTTSDHTYATVAGGQHNTASGYWATVGAGWANTASGQTATVGGGGSNTASGWDTTVAGGGSNIASGHQATVGGGYGNTASGTDSTVGGGGYNQANASYATIAGGGPSDPGNPSTTRNLITDDYGTIGGGGHNQAGDDAGTTTDASYATVGGGLWNTASGWGATVGGGLVNSASGWQATVGGGDENYASETYATVGGGDSNVAGGPIATVAGGWRNAATGWGDTVGGGEHDRASGGWSTVGGGLSNTASASYATVPGGLSNSASGDYATVPGGSWNAADGWSSFAAGRRAKANHDGSFVWADGSEFDFASTANNQFSARAIGGARFVSGIDDVSGEPTAGVRLLPGGGSWSSISDRAVKDNLSPAHGKRVLEQLMSVPISTWNYIAQDSSIRHMGPMAQDFCAAFGLGEDDKHISTVDADGVALAAIQGLHELLGEKDTKISTLEERIATLEGLVEKLVKSQAGGQE